MAQRSSIFDAAHAAASLQTAAIVRGHVHPHIWMAWYESGDNGGDDISGEEEEVGEGDPEMSWWRRRKKKPTLPPEDPICDPHCWEAMCSDGRTYGTFCIRDDCSTANNCPSELALQEVESV